MNPIYMYLFEKFLRYKKNIKPYVSPSVPEVKIAALAKLSLHGCASSSLQKQLKYFSKKCRHEML